MKFLGNLEFKLEKQVILNFFMILAENSDKIILKLVKHYQLGLLSFRLFKIFRNI